MATTTTERVRVALGTYQFHGPEVGKRLPG